MSQTPAASGGLGREHLAARMLGGVEEGVAASPEECQAEESREAGKPASGPGSGASSLRVPSYLTELL